MSDGRKIRLEVTLDELVEALADGLRHALNGQGTSIGIPQRTPDGRVVELEPLTPEAFDRSIDEIARNTAGGLLLFEVEEPSE